MLYQWHNGIDINAETQFLFGEYDFTPLHEAVADYQVIQQYYDDQGAEIDMRFCFPFARFDGAYLNIYCDTWPFFGLQNPIIHIFEDISIMFESLEKAILTVNEWYSKGVYDTSPVDEMLMHNIRTRINANIPPRTTTL